MTQEENFNDKCKKKKKPQKTPKNKNKCINLMIKS